MLKKPGGGAFKPKAPVARRRPATSLPTPVATQSQGNDELPKTVSVQDASPSGAPDVATPSSTAEPTTQPQEISNEVTTTKNATSEPPIRTTNINKSNTSRSTSVTPAAEKPAAARSQDLDTTEADSVDAFQRPEIPEPRSDALVSIASAEAESRPTASDALPSTDQSDSATLSTFQTEQPPSSTREAEVLPTPPETAPAAHPSVENSESLSTELANATAKPQKAAVTRSRKRKAPEFGTESEAETGVDTGADTGRPLKKRRASRKNAVAASAGGDDQTVGAERSANARPRATRQRKAKATARDQDSTDQNGEGNADGAGSDREDSQQEAAAKRPKRRRRRSATPEDAEALTIDPETWTIAQLTKNLRMGKRWDRAKDVETAERNRKRELQKQRLVRLGLLQEGEELPGGDVSEAGTPGPESSQPTKDPTPPPSAPAATGISMRIDANGNIIVDESSLQHDRHREADMQRGTLLVQEENEFSKRMTQQTYMRRQPKANPWTIEDTEKFYHGLRMFGTDFNMISKLFGGAKDRRQVKLKFNREERAHPVAINKCLIGEKVVAMDLEEIDGADGLEDSQTITDELARLREEREAEARRVEEEIAAESRRKREELFGKKKGKNHHLQEQDDEANHDNNEGGETDEQATANSRGSTGRQRSHHQQEHPAAKYGVGTDPDVIDETDLPTASSSIGKGRGSRGGRGGRRGGKAVFASGFGV